MLLIFAQVAGFFETRPFYFIKDQYLEPHSSVYIMSKTA